MCMIQYAAKGIQKEDKWIVGWKIVIMADQTEGQDSC